MKKPLFLSLVVLSLYTPAFLTSFAQVTPPPAAKAEAEPEKKPEITLESYETALKHYIKWSEQQAKKTFYKDLVFKKTVDGKDVKIKYTDLSPLEQSLFLIHQAENLSNHLFRLENAWKVELQKLIVEEAANVGDSVTGDMLKTKPKKEDIERYLAKLLLLRKINAIRFEILLHSVFKEYNSEIPAADQKNYLQKVTAWHDKYKLIERPKNK